MKPVFSLWLLLSLLLSLAACGDASAPTPPQTALEQAAQTAPAPEETPLSSTPGIDIDLTALSRTMVYSEVYNMMMTPENYIGKVVRMNGLCSTFESVAVDGQESTIPASFLMPPPAVPRASSSSWSETLGRKPILRWTQRSPSPGPSRPTTKTAFCTAIWWTRPWNKTISAKNMAFPKNPSERLDFLPFWC